MSVPAATPEGAAVLIARRAGIGRVRAAFGKASVCIGVHAVFAPDALQALEDAGPGRVVTCDTLAHASNGIDVMSEVAQAVCATLAAPPG